MIKIQDIHYVAALFEGEGHFGFYKCPTMQIAMTDHEPLYKIRSIMNPNVNIRKVLKKSYNIKCKDQYIFHMSGQIAIEWMMTIYLLMCPRRQEQIRKTIQQWKDIKSSDRHRTLSRNNRTRNFAYKSNGSPTNNGVII